MSNVLHTKSAYWIRQGIFDELRSFEAFEARVNNIAEEKDRGDIFEIFVEGYLATQTINQCVKHWVVGNIPLLLRERYKLPSDATGIDGIDETHDGTHVAYQVKYRQKQQLTFAEVAPFLGITERFSDRIIFTNAARLSHKALVRTRWASADVFRDLSPDALNRIEAWIKVKPIPVVRAKPDPSYQIQALTDIKQALARHDKATAVMACGTGKTLVALWATEQEAPKTVLVLVPSLTLLQQTLREWSEQTRWGISFSYLCVCSDPTVGLKNDDLNIDKAELGFRIDTDPTVVQQFLERETTDIKVVFSTYHSSPVVGDGARGLPPFDFGIFDEAHKTIGLAGSAFGYALSDENINIRKRLFLTATPRHIDIRHRDKEGEFRIYSMDDETVYGPRAAALKQFQARKGHCNVPVRQPLGVWVLNQRQRKDTMSVERKQRLDKIGFVWDLLETQWEEHFTALVQFQARTGHCNVPRSLSLGKWVVNQRSDKDMPTERKQRLDKIGFVWNVFEARWEKGFAVLKQFKTCNGHCNVPQRHREGTFELGTWVNNQRQKRHTMSAERRQRLDGVGFVWRSE